MDNNVIVKSTHAGLGDLILGVLQGLLYARLSERKLFVDWKDTVYAPLGLNLFHQLFEVDSAIYASHLEGSGAVHPTIWRSGLDLSLDQMLSLQQRTWDLNKCLKDFSLDPECLHYAAANVVMFEFRHIADLCTHFNKQHVYLAQRSSIEVLEQLAQQYLIIKSDLKKQADLWRQQHLSGLCVGVHVRQTNEPGGKNTNLDSLHAELKHMLRIYPVKHIFLCTDNQEIVNMFANEYEQLVWREKWLPVANEPVHLTVGSSQAGVQSAQDALIDMYLLACCDALIYSCRSSFGFIATLWSNSDKKIDLNHLGRDCEKF